MLFGTTKHKVLLHGYCSQMLLCMITFIDQLHNNSPKNTQESLQEILPIRIFLEHYLWIPLQRFSSAWKIPAVSTVVAALVRQVFKAEGSLGQSMMFQPTAVTAARAREAKKGTNFEGKGWRWRWEGWRSVQFLWLSLLKFTVKGCVCVWFLCWVFFVSFKNGLLNLPTDI